MLKNAENVPAEAMSADSQIDASQRWSSLQFKEPIEVESGIRLTKALSELAQNWWSTRWLDIIESFGLGFRLERAKIYAERGQVLSINVENGVVRAQVQGAEAEPYRVSLAVKTIPRAIWESILHDLGKSSHFGISLAARTLPAEQEIDAVFRSNGVLLFPDRQGEMQTKCSCLDWSNPCKHIAAVYLLLAAEFDRDPYLIFKLRGLKLDDLFSLLRPAETAQAFSEDKAATDIRYVRASAEQILNSQAALAASGRSADAEANPPSNPPGIENFWKGPFKITALIGEWQLSQEVAALPSSLGGFPFWQGKYEFLPAIRPAYQFAPQHATRVLIAPTTSIDEER